MDLEEQQLVIKWRSINELKEKLRGILGELESNIIQQNVTPSAPSVTLTEAIPEEVRKLDLSTFSAAMLTILREAHRGRSNATDARSLAKEMKSRYPLFFSKKELGEIAHGTIFPGQKMANSGLIRMEKVRNSEDPTWQYRVYWSE